jgi:predicted O-methyltransferase YrrM
MPEASSRIGAALSRYLAEHTAGEDEFLVRLKQAAVAAGIPPIWIAPEQASFMQILLRAAGAREVIEVGTLAGYSAIAMARALPPEGRVRTLEIEPRHAAFARKWVAKSDVAGKVEVHLGRGMDLLPSFETHSADAAFLDADKQGYARYLEQAVRIVRPGGLILADNALGFGQLLDPDPADPEVPALRAFNDLMAARADLQSVIVPLGDGLWVGVRR